MKLVVVGATGPLGKLLVRMALDRGHDVVAYVRNPAKLDIAHERLTVIEGQLAERAKLEAALDGAGAVLCALGSRPETKGTPLTEGTADITAAMTAKGVRRLVLVSTLSAFEPKDRFNPTATFMRTFVRLIANASYHDIKSQAEVVRASGLDWTLARVPLLTEQPQTAVATGYVGDPALKTSLSRANLAAFMLDRAADDLFVREAPAVSDARS